MDNQPIQAFNAFSVPIYRFHYDNEEMAQACVDMVHQYEKDDPEPCYYPFGYTTFSKKHLENGNVILDERLKPLADFFWGATQYLHEQNKLTGNLFYASSWLTIGRKYSYHERHHHNPHTWSGVYYARAVEGDAGIHFYNPVMSVTAWPHTDATELTEYNSLLSQNEVETGNVIIFPSYLEHKVDQQLEDRERITLAFNFNVEQ